MREAKTKSAQVDVNIGSKWNQNRYVTKKQISWRPKVSKKKTVCRPTAYKLAASFLDPSQLFFSKGWPWVGAINSSFPLGRRAGTAHSCMTPFLSSVRPPPHSGPTGSLVLVVTQPAHSRCTCAALRSSHLPVYTFTAAFCLLQTTVSTVPITNWYALSNPVPHPTKSSYSS